MVTRNSATATPADRALTITRVFDAPRSLVFKAWIDPKHVAQWWGPHGFTNPVCELEVQPGGAIRIHMRGPDGTVYPNKSVFTEVVKPERIVYSHGGGKKGGPGAHFEATWMFEAQGDKTKVTIRMLFPSAAKRDKVVKEYGAIEGGKQTLERLAEQLAKMPAGSEFVITRVFDVPRELVFKAWTEPERLKHWWGPRGFTMRSCKLDLRPGGVFHYSMQSPDGREMWGKFVYREIVAPERLVFVVSFTDEEGNPVRHPMSPTWPLEVLNTMTLSEHDGKTMLTVYGVPINATKEERKTFQAGRDSMRQGFTGTLDQLTDYLAKA